MAGGQAAGRTSNHALPAARQRRSWVAAFTFLLFVGTAWHFVHALTGRTAVVGWVAPVNESVWEHTKLIVHPVLIWAGVRAFADRRTPTAGHGSRIPVAAAVAGVLGAAIIVAGYLAYEAILGHDVFALDMLLFVVAAWASAATFTWLARRGPRVPIWLGAVVIVGVLLVWGLLTERPPDLPLFQPQGS